MDLKSLHTFLTVAKTGTISAAAEKLHSVQSNITARIKALEADLGTPLFLRSRAGMRLSAAGEVLLPHAKAVIAAARQARCAVAGFSDRPLILRLGSMETTLAVRLAPVLARFCSAYPQVRLRASTGTTEELAHEVLEGRLDMAFIGGSFPHADLIAAPTFREEMVMVTRRDLATPGDAAGVPVIVFRPGCAYRAFALGWMRQMGLAPNETFELGTLDGILGCVAAGIGVTFLPRSVAEACRHRADLRLHPLEGDARHIDTFAISSRTAPENGAVARFLECVRLADA